MDKGLQFEVIWNDNDVLEVRIVAWNGSFGGSADVYVSIGGLKEAAEKLGGFPHDPSDTVELLFGAFGKGWAGGAVSMRFYCRDGAGHAFVDAKIESYHDQKYGAQSALLVVPVGATAVDIFVEDLRRLEADQRGIAILKAGTHS